MSPYPPALESDAQELVATGSVRVVKQHHGAVNVDKIINEPSTPWPVTSDFKNSVPISRPTLIPHWPLASNTASGIYLRDGTLSKDPGFYKSLQQLRPPRRPPRPSYVPSILDASKLQDPTPDFQYRQQQAAASNNRWQRSQLSQSRYWELTPASPHQKPDTSDAGGASVSLSSLPSTTSSSTSAPDFPALATPSIPQPRHQLPAGLQSQPFLASRRSIGPPPLSKRGPSSYYLRTSYVEPILEEMPESPKSLEKPFTHDYKYIASNENIPQSRANGPHEYYTINHDDYSIYDREESSSRESDRSESDLLRKASLGKQYKPTLTTVHSSDSSRSEVAKSNVLAKSVRLAIPETSRRSLLENDNDVSPTDDQYHNRSAREQPVSRDVSSIYDDFQDQRVQEIMGSLKKGGAIENEVEPPLSSKHRRPLKLDIAAVHEAEARGSLTSLTDLIRRATRVRSNLDRGRTASRLGLFEYGSNKPYNLQEKGEPMYAHGSESLSGMLASFPAPTPQGDRPNSRWPSPFEHIDPKASPSSRKRKVPNDSAKAKRQCCGLPLLVFVLIVVVLICLIAAAIVVPVFLIVLPRTRADNESTFDPTRCAEIRPCANGGQSIASGRSCHCVCLGGFSGSFCSREPEPDCTTANAGNFPNATMGSSIPRLLSIANSTFAIPLETTLLLAAFSDANLSCSDEEALVTFDGRTASNVEKRAISTNKDDRALSATTATKTIVLREPQASIPTVVTSNGVLLDLSAETPISTAQTVNGVAPTTTSASVGSTATLRPADLDFARIAVLWILQETGPELDGAIAAQHILRSTFDSSHPAQGEVEVGSGVLVDLSSHQITSNGTYVGN